MASTDLRSLLQALSSQKFAELQAAETAVKSFETQPGFHALLLDHVQQRAIIDSSQRWIAVILLKNG